MTIAKENPDDMQIAQAAHELAIDFDALIAGARDALMNKACEALSSNQDEAEFLHASLFFEAVVNLAEKRNVPYALWHLLTIHLAQRYGWSRDDILGALERIDDLDAIESRGKKH